MHASTRHGGGWRKSTRSANNGTCVESACTADAHAVRDSTSPRSGKPCLTPDQSADFFASIKAGRFDGRRADGGANCSRAPRRQERTPDSITAGPDRARP
ncbi:DUF397 domain-containing protein [Actinoalloteichus hoggarensis]|uniref:DUF397 domain-containing protein n=1 Tax=Actinoalloteichus hoggarensis TaxID=1470176 RepID=UPI000B8A8713|nr:DUF397 domain-containing protein [Actinoalloteichus hoggarensis]